jgi:hypothetical protein
MNPTGKAGKPRNKPPNLKGETQFQRFVETAKALESDESGKTFEKAFISIIPTVSQRPPAYRQQKLRSKSE